MIEDLLKEISEWNKIRQESYGDDDAMSQASFKLEDLYYQLNYLQRLEDARTRL